MTGIKINTDVLDEAESLSQLIREKLPKAKVYSEMPGPAACRILFESRTRLKDVKRMLEEAGGYTQELSSKGATQYRTDGSRLCIVAALQRGTRKPQISIYPYKG